MAGETPDAIREAIVRARDEGLSYAETARVVGVGEATVSRILRRHRETGSIAPKPRGGGRVSPIDLEKVRAIVKAQPDIVQREVVDRLAEAGVETSRSAVARAFKKLGLTHKKRRSSRSSATGRRTSRGGKSSSRR